MHIIYSYTLHLVDLTSVVVAAFVYPIKARKHIYIYIYGKILEKMGIKRNRLYKSPVIEGSSEKTGELQALTGLA